MGARGAVYKFNVTKFRLTPNKIMKKGRTD